ncbi:TetR/AcrR family transcriptional regulator [Mediterraneibacter gnavus]|uniref:TetR/AcrR family transcriptional regulator n=1 Tax=Mediterraneibacter gnavus TaxID=33038 RepID=UPI0036D42571
MEKKVDRRVIKTRRQLKKGLAALMKEKSVNQITVKELVEEVDINRSTFYLHFKDIQDLLREIEENMEAQIKRAIEEHPIVSGNENAFYFIEDMFRVLDEEREISKALIGPNGDMGFIHRIERIIKENSKGTLEKMFPGKKEDLKYFYAFCLSGCLGLVKVWLNEGEEKSPEEMAQMTFNMIANAKDAFCQTASDFLDK